MRYDSHLMDAKSRSFTFPFKRYVSSDFLDAGRHRYDQGEIRSDRMDNESWACERYSLTINLASDINTRRNPSNFSGSDVYLSIFLFDPFFYLIPSIEIFAMYLLTIINLRLLREPLTPNGDGKFTVPKYVAFVN